jgi:hypothetical protein
MIMRGRLTLETKSEMRLQILWLRHGAPDPEIRGEGWCVHASSQMREKLLVVTSHERGLVSEDVIAKRDKSRSGTW